MPAYKDEKTGKWFCKFYYTDYTGEKKQKLKRGFELQREAKEWERNFLEHIQGTPDMTFQTLYDHYMEDISHRLRRSTISNKESRFRNNILPYFKDMPINQITPADIRRWQNRLMSKDYSQNYLRTINADLAAVLHFAVNYYGLPMNPCSKVKCMGKAVRSMKFWTLDQYNAVMKVADNPTYKTMIQILFYSGIRIGELQALTVSDCDFNNNTINIDKTFYHSEIGRPKTENSVRVVTLPPAIMNDLKKYIGKTYKPQGTDRIFRISKTSFRSSLIKYAQAAGVPIIRIHDLRHPYVKSTTKKYLLFLIPTIRLS